MRTQDGSGVEKISKPGTASTTVSASGTYHVARGVHPHDPTTPAAAAN